MDKSIVKLAIVVSVAELLAAWDLSVIDGMETELTLTDGSVFDISIKRRGDDQRKVVIPKRGRVNLKHRSTLFRGTR